MRVSKFITRSKRPALTLLVAGAAAIGACAPSSSATGAGAASGASSVAAQPIAGDVERTTFDTSLGVHLANMTRRASGLYVQDLEMGTGAVVTRGRTAVVRYAGWLPSGEQFDSGEISVTVGSRQTIPAWEEGLLGMRVGGRRRLVSPPNLAYGARGAGKIPPNAVLVFEMQVTDVQ